MTLIIQKPTGAKLNLAQTYVGIDDPDAAVYVAAVEAADGQSLETATKVAIHSFVKGCKAGGIWPAIKASCILSGARTLAGALVPLVGTAPTNVGPFVSGDYNRKTGLIGGGDASAKHLNSNRNNNADPQNNQHIAAYSTFTGITGALIGAGFGSVGESSIVRQSTPLRTFRSRNSTSIDISATFSNFVGLSRENGSTFNARADSVTTSLSQTSQAPFNGNLFIFARGTTLTVSTYSTDRLAFYSIGESLNLALLDARVTDLINAFGAAIP